MSKESLEQVWHEQISWGKDEEGFARWRLLARVWWSPGCVYMVLVEVEDIDKDEIVKQYSTVSEHIEHKEAGAVRSFLLTVDRLIRKAQEEYQT